MATLAETSEKYTYQDYAKLPEGAPYQLINGEFVMTPAPKPYHQRLLKRILISLSKYVDNHSMGEVLCAPIDVFFSKTETYQSDIIYISKDRLPIIAEDKVEGAPDLIVEILSPTTAEYDLRHKKQIYEQHNVKEYWIVDPIEKSVDVYTNKGNKYELIDKFHKSQVLKSSLIKRLEIDLSDVF